MNVHILLPRENNPVDRLVLRTVSTGFPTAEIKYDDNCFGEHTHAGWLCQLILNNNNPFWVSDADIVFFDLMQDIDSNCALMGRYEPAFHERWLDSYKVERIHTCLMRINPLKLRTEFQQFLKRFNVRLLERFGFEMSLLEYIRGSIIPTNTKPLLYDTMSKLFHVVSCERFSSEQNLRFEHLHCGSYASEVSHIGKDLTELHKKVCENIELARGLQFKQQRYYEENRIIYG